MEKKTTSKLLAKSKSSEKIYKIDDHFACAVAGPCAPLPTRRAAAPPLTPVASRPGLTSDANILINFARRTAQRSKFTFQEPQPLEENIQRLCDTKHGYTQFGGACERLPVSLSLCRDLCEESLTRVPYSARPPPLRCLLPLRRLGPPPRLPAVPQRPERELRGVEGDCDREQQPSESRPRSRPQGEGAYLRSHSGCWDARWWGGDTMPQGHPLTPSPLPQAAKSFLKGEYKDEMKVDAALELVVKVRWGWGGLPLRGGASALTHLPRGGQTLAKTMDVTPTVEKMEFATITRCVGGNRREYGAAQGALLTPPLPPLSAAAPALPRQRRGGRGGVQGVHG